LLDRGPAIAQMRDEYRIALFSDRYLRLDHRHLLTFAVQEMRAGLLNGVVGEQGDAEGAGHCGGAIGFIALACPSKMVYSSVSYNRRSRLIHRSWSFMEDVTMTVDIIIVLSILGLAVLLFASERLRVDVVALLVLIALVLTGLVTPEQAVSGFSNPAVITVWAVFILSGGLTVTGVAQRLGSGISSVGGNDTRLIVVLMLAAGVLSGFMNNIGVAAMLLPAVMGIARQRSIPPSRLLMPLAYATLLGGMISLIGTPGNILISGMLQGVGLQPFGMFDFTPAGMTLLLVGVLFMALAGRFLLPARDAVQMLVGSTGESGEAERYPLRARMALLRVPQNSRLTGRTLAECRIARALGLNILSIRRGGRLHLAPVPDIRLSDGDEVLVLGKLDRLEELAGSPYLHFEPDPPHFVQLLSENTGVAELVVTTDSPFAGQSIAQLDFRSHWGCVVLAICRNGALRRSNLRDVVIAAGDELLLYGERTCFTHLAEEYVVREVSATVVDDYYLQERLLEIRIPEGAPLAGLSLVESRLGLTFGLVALAIERSGESLLLPSVETELQVGDSVIVQGNPADLEVIRGLQKLEIERQPNIDIADLTVGPMTLVEVTLSPFAPQADRSLRDLRFREKYGLNVLAIWRKGQANFSNLGSWRLQLGDAMLLYGPRDNIKRLRSDPNFLVLEGDGEENVRRDKAPIAVILMVAVVLVTILGWLTLPIAAIIGATLMVLTGCLTMDEAYHYIEWKAVFLIAGMLPLGIALETTGAAAFLAQTMLDAIGGYGPTVVLAGLFALTALLAQFMPNPVIAVLIAPIALNAAAGFGITPYAFVMAVALAASASFLTPIAHPANILVMGPGGYRFSDYVKAGLPLLLLLMAITVVILPIIWPFTPIG